LLASGQSPNVGTDTGKSSVHLAMKLSTIDILQTLIASGAYVDFPDDYNECPIEDGIKAGESQAGHVQILLNQMHTTSDGMQQRVVNIRKKHAKTGNTLIHDCAWCANKKVTELLLETGEFGSSDQSGGEGLEELNAHGQTALHLAAFRSSKTHCDVLVKAGANPNAREKNGRRLSKETPCEMAESMGRHDTADYLRSFKDVASTVVQQNSIVNFMKANQQSRQPTGA